ncbi:hypothetical protein LWI28_004592 [Acer negundo]|uniref:PGG domain-containing protein n=1 Tax=Acer negundo TaxID=4023 RepID=A0AAD5JLH6_ACENE|nr:hypothetical protein LWI28_004592 [Acer negundo]
MGIGKYITSDTFVISGYAWAVYFYPDGKSLEIRALFELTLMDQSGEKRHKVHTKFGRVLESGPYALKYRGSMWIIDRRARELNKHYRLGCQVVLTTTYSARHHLNRRHTISRPSRSTYAFKIVVFHEYWEMDNKEVAIALYRRATELDNPVARKTEAVSDNMIKPPKVEADESIEGYIWLAEHSSYYRGLLSGNCSHPLRHLCSGLSLRLCLVFPGGGFPTTSSSSSAFSRHVFTDHLSPEKILQTPSVKNLSVQSFLSCNCPLLRLVKRRLSSNKQSGKMEAGSDTDPENLAPTIQQPEIDNSVTSSLQASQNRNTLLREAAQNGKWEEAASLLDDDPSMAVAVITDEYETALHVATGASRISFVTEIIKRMEPKHLEMRDGNQNTAFIIAVIAGNIEIATVMLDKNLQLLKIRDSRDLALKLVKDTSVLAVIRDKNEHTALHVLARKPSSIFEMKSTGNQESMSTPAPLQLVNHLWNEVEQVFVIYKELITKPSNLLFDAARLGNSGFLDVLISSYPSLVHELDENGRTIFHVAIWYNQIDVFRLIKKIGFNKEIIAARVDRDANNILHLAAKYPDQSPESGLSSVALEMQKRLIIFQEVEKLIQPSLRGAKNADDLTPQQLFAKEHKDLQRSGAQWMDSTANACSLVATLIATVVFAAAFTVPAIPVQGDWEECNRLIEEDPSMVRTAITEHEYDTALHVATKTEQTGFALRIMGRMNLAALTVFGAIYKFINTRGQGGFLDWNSTFSCYYQAC